MAIFSEKMAIFLKFLAIIFEKMAIFFALLNTDGNQTQYLWPPCSILMAALLVSSGTENSIDGGCG